MICINMLFAEFDIKSKKYILTAIALLAYIIMLKTFPEDKEITKTI